MNNCRHIRKALKSIFGGELRNLPPHLEEHLGSCARCTAYYKELIELKGLLDSSIGRVHPGELDDITFENIVRTADRPEISTTKVVRLKYLRWAWVPAAAAALILAALLYPRFAGRSVDVSDYMGLVDYDYSVALDDRIVSSDSLSGEFVASLASDDGDLEQAADELLDNSDIDDMLNGLTDSELEALSERINDLKG